MATRGSTFEIMAMATTRLGSLRAIAWGTLVSGTLDICAAILTWAVRGVAPGRVLQGVASGLLGRDSFNAGAATAALGLLLHFSIMSVIVGVFVLASRHLRVLNAQTVQGAIAIGALYGFAVYLVMTYLVVPLSAAAGRAPQLSQFIQGVIVHMLCVGVPIALITRRAALQAA